MVGNVAVSLSIKSDLDRLSRTLGAIGAETGKDARRLVADATVQLTIGGNGVKGLRQLYAEIAPAKGSVRSAPWGIGRTSRVHGERGSLGVSLYAERTARALLGSRAAAYFRLSGKRITPVAISVRHTRRGPTLRGVNFRSGRNAAPVYATRQNTAGVALPSDAKSLNLRALAVFFELGAREAGRGLLGKQFTMRGLRGTIAAVQDEGRASLSAALDGGDHATIGRVTYHATKTGTTYGRVEGFIAPNTRYTDSLNARAVSAVLRDKEQYLSRKILQNFTRPR